MLHKELAIAQNRMKQFVDRKRNEWKFKVRDIVYLIRLKTSHHKAFLHSLIFKLSLKFYGTFPIVAKFGIMAYKLQLPPTSQIHLMFHVSTLKRSVGVQQVSSSLPTFVCEPSPPNGADFNFEKEHHLQAWCSYNASAGTVDSSTLE